MVRGQRERLCVEIVEFEVGSLIGVADEANDSAGVGGIGLSGSGLLSEGGRSQGCGKGEENQKAN